MDRSDLEEMLDLGAWARVVVGFGAFVGFMFALSSLAGSTL